MRAMRDAGRGIWGLYLGGAWELRCCDVSLVFSRAPG